RDGFPSMRSAADRKRPFTAFERRCFMTYHHPCLQQLSAFVSQPPTYKKLIVAIAAVLLSPLLFAKDQSQTPGPRDPAQVQVDAQSSNITIPAGTHLALVLTQ